MTWAFSQWQDAPWLLLLPIALLLGWWWRRSAQRRVRQLLGRRETALAGQQSHGVARALLASGAAVSFACALLGPVSPGNESRLGPDLVLCVDVSRSMAAGDVTPSRFAGLQQQVHALIDGQRGSRLALLAFAGEVQPIAPLTADGDAVVWLLDELAPGTLRGGTDLAAVIEAAGELLQRTAAVGDIVLLTDGEDFGGRGARAAAAAAEAGHRVHCLGFGSTAGSKIVVDSDGGQGFLRDGAGNEVITCLDVEALRNVAAAGNGRLVLAGPASELLALWRDDLQPHAARQHIAGGGAGSLPQFQWPLLAGVLLMMLHMCLPERRR